MKTEPFEENDQLREQLRALEARVAEYEQAGRQLQKEQRRAEEALLVYEQALAAMSQGLLICDASEPHHPVRYANPAFLRIAEMTATELLGRSADFLIGWAATAESAHLLLEALVQGKPWCGEVHCPPQTKESGWAELTLAPLPSEGPVRYLLGTLHDISDRKSLEYQLHQSQKLEAVGRLAGGIAHDFNNILTVILGHCELMEAHGVLDATQRANVVEIRDAGQLAVRLTRQLLAFSRKQLLLPRVLNLNAVVSDLDSMLQRLIGEDIRLTYALENDLWLVQADPSQIEQVILNLTLNARDAMPQGGDLIIETINTDLDESYAHGRAEVRPGRYVLLALSDTGIGMDAPTRERVFEPFFTTKELGKGSGLGLATVYGIVKQSGGYIYVYSEPGKGTTFKTYLPAVEGEASPAAQAELDHDRPFLGTETVLLVEDNEGLRNLSETVLRRNGYQVLAAADGVQALEAASRCPSDIHLLVTDVVMPQMSGRELADRFAQLRPGTRVLYLSGYTDEAVYRYGLLNTDRPFLQKPFTPSVLLRKVREVLDAPGR